MESVGEKFPKLLDLGQELFEVQGKKFDFSIESLKSINTILKQADAGNENGEGHLDSNKLLALGAYLGETVIRNVSESAWDEGVEDERDARITFMSGSKIWPMRRVRNCWKKNEFVNGDIFEYASEIIAAENRKVALRKRKKRKKAWWHFWEW